MAAPSRLTIAHVTPHAWRPGHEVNLFAARSAEALERLGHRVVIVSLAPPGPRAGVRQARAAIRDAGKRPDAVLDGWRGRRTAGGIPVLAVGSGLPLPRGRRTARQAPVPLDTSRATEALMRAVPFDVVHVHDPFAPSLTSTALRHSRSLNVATFHEPTERILSTQLARPLVEVLFGRLDARTASSQTTRELLERFFPGGYELVAAGAQVEEPWWPERFGWERRDGTDPRGERPVRIAYLGHEERGAVRLFLRALRRLPDDLVWEAAVWLPEQRDLRLSRRLRERVEVLGPAQGDDSGLVAAADVVVSATGGAYAAPRVLRWALRSGTVPVASIVPDHEELLADGERGLLFAPGDAITLTGQLERLIRSATLRRELAAGGEGAVPSWEEVGAQLDDVYSRLCARRHDPDGRPEVRRRLSGRREIHVDLHMHTDHSPDCATPVELLVDTAKERGLGAIAVTDHNEVSGAFAAREYAREVGGLEVIVAEEVKTAEQGEVIGLFLEEKIERGMTMAQTIAEIRRQGGLVYMPHPFDRLHSVPDYEHLLDVVEEIDILEVFNPRVALSAFNEEAERFATKYRIVPGAGSDSHVAQGLGSVATRVREFEGPEEFLEAMRDADIVRKHRNLVYVQALKWMQTAGGRGGGGSRRRARSS